VTAWSSLYPTQAGMASKFVWGGVTSAPVACDNAAMPRKPRPNPKPTRRPTYIRAWRKHRDLTMQQVCEALEHLHDVHISEGQLSRIETGKQPYAQDLLETIADVLLTDPASLIMRDPSQPEIWSIYDTLTPVQRRQVVDYADFISKRSA
jgi:transcriptional regulator with XRE-family HTH domain